MKKRGVAFTVVFVFLTLVPLAFADPLFEPDDFAYGIPVEADGRASIYEAAVPLDVYQGVMQPSLSDVRVFNADGVAVPHAILPGGATEEDVTEVRPLPVFPLREGVSQTSEALSVLVSRGGNDRVDVRTDANSGASRKIAAYLLDASTLGGPLRAVTLEWSGPEETVLLSALLEASDDLKSWRTLVNDGVLAQFFFKKGQGSEGTVPDQNRLEFAPIRAKYLRLRLRDPQRIAPDLEITSARALVVTGQKSAERQWKTVKGQTVAGSPRSCFYDTEALLPIDRVEVVLPEGNRVLKVQLLSSWEKEGVKGWRYQGLVYRLKNEGHEITSEPINPNLYHPKSSHRYWFLDLLDASSEFGSELPSLKVGWVPQKIAFVAEGKGPYTIAYGNASLLPLPSPTETLSFLDTGVNRGQAVLREPKTLGGPSKLLPPPPPPPSFKEVWGKRLALVGLILATVFLGWIAYRLARQVSAG